MFIIFHADILSKLAIKSLLELQYEKITTIIKCFTWMDDTSWHDPKSNDVLLEGRVLRLLRDLGCLETEGETSMHRLTRTLDWRCWNNFSVSTMTFWNSKVWLSLRSHGLHSKWGKLESWTMGWLHNCSTIFNNAWFDGLNMFLRWPASPTARQSRQEDGSIAESVNAL